MSRKIKEEQRHVALFLRSELGGLAGMRLHLAEALLRRGYRVDILVPWLRRGLDRIPVGARAIELTRWSRRWRSIPAHYAAIPALVRYLRRERPHGFLSATTPLNIAAVWARRLSGTSVRLVVSQHNPLSAEIADGLYRSGPVMPFLVRRWYPNADAVVAISRGVADDLCRNIGLKHRNLNIIYNPVITERSDASMNAEVEHVWLRDKTSPVIMTAGRFVRQKRLQDLITAFIKLRSSFDARLLILGDGRERERLTDLVRKGGIDSYVDMPGGVENPYAYMARADLFVLPSHYEGFGNVVVESLACGCPVVATDCQGGVGEILDGGRYGRLVPVGDINALARAMRDTLDEPPDRELLRRRGMDFHVDKIAPQYMDLLDV